MPRPTDTIRVAAAEKIFTGVKFERIQIMGETIAYKAIWQGIEFHDKNFTRLCKRLWDEKEHLGY